MNCVFKLSVILLSEKAFKLPLDIDCDNALNEFIKSFTRSIPDVSLSETCSLYVFKDSPKDISLLPKASILLSPANAAAKPPLFGNAEASSLNAEIAVVDFVILSTSMPLTLLPYSVIAFPNGISFAPKSAISLSPAKAAAQPPLFGNAFAKSDSACPALTDSSILSEFTPSTASP